MAENEKSEKIKPIKSNHGRQFDFFEADKFCEYNGIQHNLSAPRTPQQNGVTKRKNKNLIEAGRTLLAVTKLLEYFWVEAVNIAYYTQNSSLIHSIHMKTPYKLWK